MVDLLTCARTAAKRFARRVPRHQLGERDDLVQLAWLGIHRAHSKHGQRKPPGYYNAAGYNELLRQNFSRYSNRKEDAMEHAQYAKDAQHPWDFEAAEPTHERNIRTALALIPYIVKRFETPSDKLTAVLEAYVMGHDVTVVARRVGLPRTSLYHVLKSLETGRVTI